jgi:hypothetical protein
MLFAVMRDATYSPVEFLFIEFAHGVQFFLLHILLSISRPNLAKTLSVGPEKFFLMSCQHYQPPPGEFLKLDPARFSTRRKEIPC